MTAARLAPILPVVAFLLYAFATPGLTRGDSAGVYVTAAALVEGRGFAIDGYTDALARDPQTAGAAPANFPQVAYAAGHYYHAVPPGRALLAAPLYALGLALAPLLGPETPAVLVSLLGPLLGALVVAAVYRRLLVSWSLREAALITAGFALVLFPWASTPSVPILAAALAVIAGMFLPLDRLEKMGKGALAGAGFALGSLVLIDYLAGGLGLLLIAVLAITSARRQVVGNALVLIASALVPLLALAAWQTMTFGLPWRLAFRFEISPAGQVGRLLLHPVNFRAATLVALLLAILSVTPPLPAGRFPRALLSPPVIFGVALALTAIPDFFRYRSAVALSVRWWQPSALVPLLAVAFGLALMPLLWPRLRPALSTRAIGTAMLACTLLPFPALVAPPAAHAAEATVAENYAAPFAIETNGAVRPLWSFDRGKGQAEVGVLRLDAGARAVGPWVDVWPGSAYTLTASGDGPLRAIYAWEDVARNPLATQTATFGAGAARRARFAAPVGAAGLRLYLEAAGGAATVTDLRLELVGGVRVEPFPDGQRAALAFSFDWESAMGGLIHSRSEGNGEGEGATVGLRADGGPSVADAEEKGRRMRDGAIFLADLFARYDIDATFYATGYNLLDGNPSCQKYLGDPIYRNANAANGWGSDWWRTHPWYGDDPCATEVQAPAWYFASLTRELAAGGHEIASHSFGHLYVRGVTPEQLAADLAEWNRAAVALGLPPATGFAFPWTSSNSLDAPFWAAFARAGMTTLTRIYQPDLRHPYELDRVRGAPELVVFPDYYLASKAAAQDEALARIDTTLALRGYHSLWDHPNEALEQGGQVIWSRVVDYAAAQRERGLWIAPVGEIAAYGTATREVAVTALPVAGGTRLTIESRADRPLDGLTLRLPATGAITSDGRAAPAGGQVILPRLEPGGGATVVVRR